MLLLDIDHFKANQRRPRSIWSATSLSEFSKQISKLTRRSDFSPDMAVRSSPFPARHPNHQCVHRGGEHPWHARDGAPAPQWLQRVPRCGDSFGRRGVLPRWRTDREFIGRCDKGSLPCQTAGAQPPFSPTDPPAGGTMPAVTAASLLPLPVPENQCLHVPLRPCRRGRGHDIHLRARCRNIRVTG